MSIATAVIVGSIMVSACTLLGTVLIAAAIAQRLDAANPRKPVTTPPADLLAQSLHGWPN